MSGCHLSLAMGLGGERVLIIGYIYMLRSPQAPHSAPLNAARGQKRGRTCVRFPSKRDGTLMRVEEIPILRERLAPTSQTFF